MAASAWLFRIVSLFAALLLSIARKDTAIYIQGVIVKLYLLEKSTVQLNEYLMVH